MGEAIAFHNHSFTIFLNVGILFGPLLLQMSSKFIKTSKIRNSEEIPYGLQHVTALWITKCDKMDYKVRQGLQSVSRWITKCDGITKCLYSDLVFCQLEEAVTFQFTKCAHLPTPPPLHKKWSFPLRISSESVTKSAGILEKLHFLYSSLQQYYFIGYGLHHNHNN